MGNDTPLKERIRRGDIVIGVSAPMTVTKSELEDILGKDDYGFVMTDSQHSPFSEHQMVDFCNMADEVGIPVHLRIDHPRHVYLLGNLADLGPAMLEVPLVEDAATVREAIEWFYFPPVGRRSFVGGNRWGAELGKRHEHVRRVVEQQRGAGHPDRDAPRHREHQGPRRAGSRHLLMGAVRPRVGSQNAPPSSLQDRR